MPEVVGGVNPGILGGIIGAVLFAGFIFVVVGYLYYRRSLGKGFFTSEKTKTGGAAKVKAAPQAPNLAEMGIGLGHNQDDEYVLEDMDADARGIRISNGVVYQNSMAYAADSDMDLEHRSRVSDPGVSAVEQPFPGRTHTVNQGLASMANVDVSSHYDQSRGQQYQMSKQEEAAYYANQNANLRDGEVRVMDQQYQSYQPQQPQPQQQQAPLGKLERERLADMHYARLQEQQQGGSGAAPPQQQQQQQTITVIEPPPPSYPAGPAPGPASDIKIMGNNGFPAEQPVAAPPAVQAAAPAASGQDEFICVRAYHAQLDDEMELTIGDRVILKQSFPDGWGSGQNLRTNKEGVFPLSAIVAASLAEGSLKIVSG
ncbi:hypothetical protein HDU97_006818 [Phlyctochytrium planicorne]|nr:hypothetical protein HDU97_006818 [Phlyctochytrium planicorne]